MAKYRTVHTKFWNDGWIRENLNPLDRYLFLYLITNEHCNLCGIYELPMSVLSFETGIDKGELERSFLPRLAPKIQYKEGWVYILNFDKYHIEGSPKLKKGMEASLNEVPSRILSIFDQKGKGMDSLSPVAVAVAVAGVSPNSASAETPPFPDSGPPLFEEWMKGRGFRWVDGPEVADGSFPDVWGEDDGARLPLKRLRELRSEHKRLIPAPPKEKPVLAQNTDKLISLISDELKDQFGAPPIFGSEDRAILSGAIRRTSFDFVKKYGKWFFRNEKIDKKWKFSVKAFSSNNFINQFIAETGTQLNETE